METPVPQPVTPPPPQARANALERPQLLDDSSHVVGTQSGGLLEYWRILQRRRATVIVVACLGLLSGILYTLPQTPVYRAHAVIEMQSINSSFLYGKEANPNSTYENDPTMDIETQVRILQSRALLTRVVKRLGLEKKELTTPPTRLDAWRKALRLTPATPPSREEVIGNAAGGLTVKAQENTRLIDVSSDSTNPQMAADFVNTLTSEYKELNLEARYQTTQDAGNFLTKQMEDLRIKLEQYGEAMQAYASQNGLVMTDQKDSAADQKVKQLQEALSTAQIELIARQSRYENASRIPLASLGEIQDDPSLRATDAKLLDLRTQKAQLLLTYTPEHSKVQKIQEQIAALEPSLAEGRTAIMSRLRNEYEFARDRERKLQEEFDAAVQHVADQANGVSHYKIMEREVETTRAIYDTMLQRVKEAGVASALRASNVRVVDSALPPVAPYKPSISRNASIGLLSGIFGGVLLVVFLDRADRSVQEPGDIQFFLGVPELGVVPSAAADIVSARPTLPFGADLPVGELALVAKERAHSAMSEAIRTVLTSIMFASPDAERPQVIVVSSAAPREGKSTLATNLAVTLAETSQKVLLIDADMRRPNLHRVFGLENEDGLAELLRAAPSESVNGHVRGSGIPNLSLLTSGPPRAGNPTLLYSDRLRHHLERFRKDYDTIFVDTPPMLTMADARVIARYADAVILVARVNQTSRQALRDACQRLLDDGANLIGAVLNDWNPKKSSRYGYSQYYQKYKHYYAAGQER